MHHGGESSEKEFKQRRQFGYGVDLAALTKREGGTTIKTGKVVGDDRTVELQRVADYLVSIRQGVASVQFVSIGPYDTAAGITSPSCFTDLCQALQSLIGQEQTVQMLSIGVPYQTAITFEPRLGNTCMGEKIALAAQSGFPCQLEKCPVVIKQGLEDLGSIRTVP